MESNHRITNEKSEDDIRDKLLNNGLLLPFDRFQNWINCICLVTFDIELGQAIEKIFPAHVKLTEKEKTNICYLSFPDSNSGCMGDTKFHFRTRLCQSRKRSITAHLDYNRNCLTALQTDPSYFYGYVYFRQVRDKSARRGYFQKSLVIITRLPFINFFTKIVSVIAPQYFENGESALIAACHDIDQWASPSPGSTLNLNLMNLHLQVHIPHQNDNFSSSPQSELPSSGLRQSSSSLASFNLSSLIVINSAYELNLFRCFLPVISHIQLIWELVLTCEPLIVMTQTPDICCQVVQSLISLIWPLKYSSDFRPFFTIHDSEFKEYTEKSQPPPQVILGVTNPFFAKTLQHWPHIIRICEYSPSTPNKNGTSKILKEGTIKTLECKPGLYTKYKPFLQKDRSILKSLFKGHESGRPYEVQSAFIRKYFLELTSSFLIPLERYMASLMPLQKDISPFKAAPIIQPFNPDDFLKTLCTHGPQLTSGIKGDWASLYRKFFRTPNFSRWFEDRYNEVSSKLKALHIESFSQIDLFSLSKNKAEVEIVDLVLRLKDELRLIQKEDLPVGKNVVNRLEIQLKKLINLLPQDLKVIFEK